MFKKFDNSKSRFLIEIIFSDFLRPFPTLNTEKLNYHNQKMKQVKQIKAQTKKKERKKRSKN